MNLPATAGGSSKLALGLRIGLSSLAYFLAQALAFKFPDSFGLLAAFWPASGIALAVLLLNPRRRWPILLSCLFVAGLAANLTTPRPFMTSFGFMVANLCETTASAWLITRLCGPVIRFNHVPEVRALIAAVLLINAGTSLIGAGFAWLTMGTGFWGFYRTWFVVDGLGLLLVTPLIIVWATPWSPLAGRRWIHSVELVVLIALGSSTTWFAFGRESVTTFVDVRPYMLLVFLVWAALRAGPRGMMTLLGVMATIAIVCTATDYGSFPLGGADSVARLFAVQMFLGILGLTGLLLTAAITQKRESAVLLQAVADGTTDAIYVKDRQGRYLFMNAAAARVVGKPIFEAIGQDDTAFFSAAEVATLHQEDQVTLQSSEARDYEKSLKDAAGVERIFHTTTGPLRGADGQVLGLFGIAHDMTQQKQAETAIREISEQQEAILQTAMDGFWMVDAQGRILVVNESYCRMSGYSEAELRSMSVQDLEVIESAAEIVARIKKIQTCGTDRFESQHRRKDGSVFDVEVSVQHQPNKSGWVVAFLRDITERKRAAATQRANEARMDFALRTIQTGAWELDLRDHTAYRTLLHDQIFGYATLLPQWTYEMFLDHVLPEDRLEVDRQFRAATAAQSDWNFECRIRRADGEVRWIWAAGSHHQGPVGQPVRLAGIVQDITARKQALELLQQSEARFRILFEHAADCILLLEIMADGIPVIRDANPMTFQILGYDRAELIDQPVTVIEGDPNVLELVEQRRQKIKSKPGTTFENRHRCKDGTIRAFECSVAELQIGSKTFAISVERDITTQKQVEKELRLQGSALRATANAIVITDRQGTVVWANPAFTKLTGYTVSEVLGKNPRVLKSGEHGPDFYRQLWETINAGQVWSSEVVNKRKDGTLYTEEMTITPVQDEHGEIAHFIAIKQDVTARKRVEHALQASNRQLVEAAAELGAMQRQVVQQESLRALGQMASGMAHDFNNTLSPIIGFSELLLKFPAKLRDLEEARRFIQLINIAGHDAAEVVRRLREFGHQRGVGELSEAIDLGGLILQTVELTRPRWKDQAQANGITIQLATDLGNVPLIAGEEFAIRELLTNLVFNAVDALPTGGKITIGMACEAELVRLWVSDNGTGMTEEVRQRCFEPFYTTKGEKGTGLGLSMVHGIVQRHGGSVEITSELGRGTTFTIRLPVHRPQTGPRLVPEPMVNRQLRVLVVDDEPLLCEIVKEWLTADGHPVVTAENGATALAQVKAGPRFDLMITDRAMPDMNGEQLATAINAIDPNLPIVLMTGFGDLMKINRDLPPHIRAVLSKPITEKSLREVLTKIFAGSKDREE